MKQFTLLLLTFYQKKLNLIISNRIISIFCYLLLIWNRWFLKRENQKKSACFNKIKNVEVLTIYEIKALVKKDESLKKVVAIIKENFEREDFKVPFLAKSVCKARVTLYREIKKKTGRTAITFIKLVRLLEADELLKSTNISIANISYQVGFKAPSYFSTTYKKEFGCSPGEVRSKYLRLNKGLF